MPSASAVNRCLGKKKGHLSHREIMNKRHEKKRKKEKKNSVHQKKKLLSQYNELNKTHFSNKKDTSMKIMEVIEEIKDNKGVMNDKHYLDVMDLLMALNKNIMETQTRTETQRSAFPHDDYYYDRTPSPANIYLSQRYQRPFTEQNNINHIIRDTYDILTRYNRILDSAEDAF